MSARRVPGVRRTSLRTRVVLITSACVTAMVAAAGGLLMLVVYLEFVDAADWQAGTRAEEVAAQAATGDLPSLLPPRDEQETAIQVVVGGEVVSRTINVPDDRVLPLPEQEPGAMEELGRETLPVGGDGPYRVAALGVETADGPATVFVAVSTEDLVEVVETAAQWGGIGVVALLLPLGLLLWVAVGRTLAPVGAIRAQAATITDARLDERVPEPARLDEIGRLARTINAMLDRLHESSELQRRFLADAAHELRSPVASLRAQLEGRHIAGPREVSDLLAETLRLQALVDQLLLLARSDAGMAGVARRPVDLDDEVEGAVTAAGTEGTRPDVTVTRDVHPVQVLGDPTLLELVVRNLVGNALRYAESEVRVSLHRQRDLAVLTVDDDGPGIPEEERARVFDRFTRLDGPRDREHGGVGLGLAIVADVVAAHDGSVQALASPLGGARMQVELPVSDPGPRRGHGGPVAPRSLIRAR